MYFPSDMISDQAEKFFVSEIIREKILMYLDDEVPHGMAVLIEKSTSRTEISQLSIFLQ